MAPAALRNPPKLLCSFAKASEDTRIPPRSGERGLLQRQVMRLIDHRWSNYPVYAYGNKGPDWLKTNLILSYFGGRGRHQAYREKVQNINSQFKM